MADHRYRDNPILAEFLREPHGGRVAAVLAAVAVLYAVYAVVTTTSWMVVSAPVLLLLAGAEVLPAERLRVAGALRIVGFLYLVVTPFVVQMG